MTTQPIILITGANRGIGLAILQSLALLLPQSTLLLGCRDTSKGEAAITDLRAKGIQASVRPIQLDVTANTSLRAAVAHVESTHGHLDVLINNAGCAAVAPNADVYDTNVINVALCTALFLPLLRKSGDARVINVSSGRASVQNFMTGNLPMSVSVPYSVSKVALNAVTVEMRRAEENDGVVFAVANPGHCRTEFNGFRGMREPMEGANVVIECVVRPREEVEHVGFS